MTIQGFGSVIVGVNTTLTHSNCVVLVDASGAAVTITLPAATITQQLIMVKKIDGSANAVTVQRAGGDSIEGAATVVLASLFSSVTLIAGDGLWLKMAST